MYNDQGGVVSPDIREYHGIASPLPEIYLAERESLLALMRGSECIVMVAPKDPALNHYNSAKLLLRLIKHSEI